MNDKIRKILPLVGALALTSSALLAGTGAAFAGKAEPTATVKSATCDEQTIDGVTTTDYTVQYDLSANKGRWLYGSAVLMIDGTPYRTTLDPDIRIDKKANLQVDAGVSANAQSATMVLTFLNRKGATAGTHETLPFCSVG